MNRKSFLICGLLSLISSYAYSMEIVGGKLLSHQEWTTGPGKAFFNETTEPKVSINALKLPTKNQKLRDQYIYAHVQALDVQDGGSSNTLSGEHTTGIWNSSILPQTYVVTHTVCAFERIGPLSKPNSCASSMDTIRLEYQGHLIRKVTTGLLIAKSEIQGKDSSVHAFTTISNEAGTIDFITDDDRPITKL
ncbi:MAG: hypothetical protein ACYCQI_10940 [Gammaproteobacteria bacterium]